jgi:dihydroorotase
VTELVIRGGRLLDPGQGLDQIGDLLIREGRIAALGAPGSLSGDEVLPAEGLVVCPGFIDLHCHLREPGYEDKETIATGSRAAAAGGFTTLCCMPNTNPPLDQAAVVEYVQEIARRGGVVRVLPIGCVSQGRRGEALAELAELAEAGVVGFSDDGSPVADSRLMRSALEYSRMLGLPIIDHCEEPTLARGGLMNEGPVSTRLGLKGMPAAAEDIAVERDLALAELTGGWVHIAHVSTAGAVERIRRARSRGLRVTAEVTPHHLVLTDAWVAGGGRLATQGQGSPSGFPYDTATKVNPPLRTAADVRAVLEGLRDGTIEAIATDHAPHDSPDKLCEYGVAAFGISGLETALGLLLTLVHSGQLELATLVERLTAGPARLLGARGEGLGTLRVGALADITILDLEREWVVDPSRFASKGKNTPLAGLRLRGQVVATLSGGKVVYRA